MSKWIKPPGVFSKLLNRIFGLPLPTLLPSQLGGSYEPGAGDKIMTTPVKALRSAAAAKTEADAILQAPLN